MMFYRVPDSSLFGLVDGDAAGVPLPTTPSHGQTASVQSERALYISRKLVEPLSYKTLVYDPFLFKAIYDLQRE